MQEDGEISIVNSTIINNLSLLGSIAIVYNSLNPFEICGGYISQNGFIHSKVYSIDDFWFNATTPRSVMQASGGTFLSYNFALFLQTKSNYLSDLYKAD